MNAITMQAIDTFRVQEAARTNAAHAGSVQFEDVRRAAAAVSTDDMQLQWFGKELRGMLDRIPMSQSVSRAAVDVSPEALTAMRQDPAYKAQVLQMITRDLESSYADGKVSMYIYVGRNVRAYRARAFASGDDSGFDALADQSFYTREQAAETPAAEPVSLGCYRAFKNYQSDVPSAAGVKNTARRPIDIAGAYGMIGMRRPTAYAFQA